MIGSSMNAFFSFHLSPLSALFHFLPPLFIVSLVTVTHPKKKNELDHSPQILSTLMEGGIDTSLQLLTDQMLTVYADYVASTSDDPNVLPIVHERVRQYKESGLNAFPSSVEEALAPLEVLYGRTLLHATGIALHGTESVVCYVEDFTGGATEETENSSMTTGRFLYKVGEYTLYSHTFARVPPMRFSLSVDTRCGVVKHLLALQMALKLQATGMKQDNIQVRVVDAEFFRSLLQTSLSFALKS
ncbi:hypothetical protein AGDE_06748 [Angomonas deanei]|nr:hypothetical protein AGDE_06748 [Angomonas deanei]|eukprot:EPY36776.1 hypothetical protein AGDE_06748 [Angomonas deanei]